jgi:hypothetical protein
MTKESMDAAWEEPLPVVDSSPEGYAIAVKLIIVNLIDKVLSEGVYGSLAIEPKNQIGKVTLNHNVFRVTGLLLVQFPNKSATLC